MNNKTISFARKFEISASERLTKLRERLWYEQDVNSIKGKLLQCERNPLTKDQIEAVQAYWMGLTGKKLPYYWHEYFYSRNGEFSVRYVPTCFYHSDIIYRLNNRPLTMAYTDKCSLDNYFADVNRPKTIIRNSDGFFFDDKRPITRDEALALCRDLESVVIKPSMIGMWGCGVRLFSSRGGRIGENETLEDLFGAYKENFIVQEKVIQHPEMARLNPTSLNTLRVLSFHRGDEVYILYAVVRIGRKDKQVDNETAGGINADILLENGCVRDCAYGTPAEKRIPLTDVGTPLKGYRIPAFSDAMQIVKDLHKRLPYFSLVGWDFGIDSEGKPVLIEWNRCPDLSQTAHGPAFGEMTEEIIKYALSRRDTFNIRLWMG